MKRCSLIGLFVLASMAPAQDMPLSQVLIPGEGWKAVGVARWPGGSGSRAEAVAPDGDGNPIVATRGADIGTLTLKGYKQFAHNSDATAMAWSPEGHLLTIEGKTLYSRSSGKMPKRIKMGVTQFAISPNGEIYYIVRNQKDPLSSSFLTPPSYLPTSSLYRVGHVESVARDIPASACLAFWRDSGTLLVGDAAGDQVFTYRIGKDGSLDAKEGYYTLRTRGREPSGVKALTLDTDDRLYAATAIGVQVFDPTGRMCGVINPPARSPVTSMAFAGPARDQLYVVCDGKLFVRKTKVKGFVPTVKKP